MSTTQSEKVAFAGVVDRVRGLMKEHHQWRGRCLNLIASENLTSLAVREAMASDLAHRYAEGKPYDRNYRGTRYTDELELLAVGLAERIFGAEYANVQPISGSVANIAMFYALTNPGDTILTLEVPHGGHISYMEFGGAGVRGLKVKGLPFNREEMNIDLDATLKAVKETKPKLILLGGSLILFPQPVRELKALAEEEGIYLAYDAAHVLGLIAGGKFQDPIKEGADLVTGSTHKTFPGPQGGMVLCRGALADKIDRAVFPGLVSNHHLHRLPGLAVALAEMGEFGREYAGQIVRNSKALATALYEAGFEVLCYRKGFTESHQVVMDVSKLGGGDPVSGLLEKANIICNKNLLPWDGVRRVRNPSGIRLGTAEVTRLGMRESEMGRIAGFIKALVVDGKSPADVRGEVEEFTRAHSSIKYSFNSLDDAYKYLEFH